MPQDYTATNPQTGETVRWDGKAWTPVPKPGAVNRAVTSFTGLQEGTTLNPLSKGFYAGLGDPETYTKAPGKALSALNPASSSMDAAATAIEKMKGPGALDKIAGAIEYLISGVPYAGPMAAHSMEQARQGDYAGSAGSAASAGLVGTGLAHAAPAMAEKLTPQAIADSMRGPVRAVLGVGKGFEQRIAEEHHTALTDYNAKLSQIMDENRRSINEGRQSHEAAVANVEKQRAEATADYRAKIQAIKDKYSGQVEEKEARTSSYKEREAGGLPLERSESASASQSASEAKRSAMGDAPRSGPVFRRLQGMTNQVYGMIDNLQDRIRSYNQKQWRSFDGAVDEAIKKKTGEGAQVDWTPVQQAVKDAENNILKGSPESITIFRNIMRESPQLDQASVFKTSQATEAAQNLKEVLNSRFMDEATKKRIEAQLHAQGVTMERVMGKESASPGTKLPFADARGYFTELGSKLNGAQLPGDVYHALDHVRDVADEQITKVTRDANQDGVYRRLKDEYKTYKQNFDDPDSAIHQFDKLDTPEKRVDFLASGKGQNLIDSLSKYKGFGSDPNLPGRVRSLVRQIRDLPSEKALPKTPDRPSFPEAPELKDFPSKQELSLKEPPKEVEPLDITRKRIEQLEHMAKTWSQFQPNQARWIRAGISQRTIGRILSNPAFREWVARQGGTP